MFTLPGLALRLRAVLGAGALFAALPATQSNRAIAKSVAATLMLTPALLLWSTSLAAPPTAVTRARLATRKSGFIVRIRFFL